MKIQEKDYRHGAVLTQIVEHSCFTALNKADTKYGHYTVNSDTRLFVKTTKQDPSKECHFNFKADDLRAIQDDVNGGWKTYLCLVCGLKTVCILNEEQIKQVINLSSPGPQWLKIAFPVGGSLRVWGQQGKLNKTIPHNAFPDVLFEEP